MFYGNFIELDKFYSIYNQLTIIQKYIEQLDDPLPKGQVIISNSIKANFLNYQTKKRDQCIWEAHKQEIDLHYIVKGYEYIDIADNQELTAGPYHEKEDYYLLQGVQKESLFLQPKQFLLFFQNEPHRTGICQEYPENIQKIVFKIGA